MSAEETTETEDMNQVAMSIILHAGDARAEIRRFYEALAGGDRDQVQSFMDNARKEITEAHRAQTKLIQSEARGVKHTMSLLFSHAQDTLMTINSEIITAVNLLAVFDQLDRRLSALENPEN